MTRDLGGASLRKVKRVMKRRTIGVMVLLGSSREEEIWEPRVGDRYKEVSWGVVRVFG